MEKILRPHYISSLKKAFEVNPIVAILGPRQCGKSTLAKYYCNTQTKELPPENYFDLESIADQQRLQNPQLMLESLDGLIIIDEIQRQPELFSLLRYLVDQDKNKQFLILGSASRELINQSYQSLAGRISYIELTPFSYEETEQAEILWARGGFPKSFLAKSDEISWIWREDYIRTFLEQDIPNLGIQIPAPQLRRFWMMLAHYHGNIFNASELASSLSLSSPTIRKYLDILTGTFMIRELQPWRENIAKRQVKSPKIYFKDSGLFHSLLGIHDKNSLLTHPRLGASWEGFALEEVIRHMKATPENCYFWSVHAGAECDLLIFHKGKRFGFEFKFSDKVAITKSMKVAEAELNLDYFFVIYPGNKTFPLDDKIKAIGLETFCTYDLKNLT